MEGTGDGPQRVDEMGSPPVVGASYLVPTVRHEWNGELSDWPVMGPRHEDPELGFPYRHQHVDLRFLTDRQARWMRRVYATARGRYGRTRGGAVAVAAAAAPLVERFGETMAEPRHEERTCRTPSHHYPVAVSVEVEGFERLHARYEGRRCGRDAAGRLVCPHRGFALGTLAPDAAGRVTCPLHGLSVDVATGVVVARPRRSGDRPRGAGRRDDPAG